MRRISLLALSAAALAAGCAQNPDTINASYVSPMQFSAMSCGEMRQEADRIQSEMTDLVGKQRAERNSDLAWTTGGALLFFPAMLVAAAGPDHADEIAELRGEAKGLNFAARERDCL